MGLGNSTLPSQPTTPSTPSQLTTQPSDMRPHHASLRRASRFAPTLPTILQKALTWSHFDLQKVYLWKPRPNSATILDSDALHESFRQVWDRLNSTKTPSLATITRVSHWTDVTESDISFEENLDRVRAESAFRKRLTSTPSLASPSLGIFEFSPGLMRTSRVNRQLYAIHTGSSSDLNGDGRDPHTRITHRSLDGMETSLPAAASHARSHAHTKEFSDQFSPRMSEARRPRMPTSRYSFRDGFNIQGNAGGLFSNRLHQESETDGSISPGSPKAQDLRPRFGFQHFSSQGSLRGFFSIKQQRGSDADEPHSPKSPRALDMNPTTSIHLPLFGSTQSLPKAIVPLSPLWGEPLASAEELYDAAVADGELLSEAPILETGDSLSPAALPLTPRQDENWFRVSIVPETPETHEEFVRQLPDHLPSSPLCPKHPKHKSKGRGRCPVHGRNRTSEDSLSEEGEPPIRRKKNLELFL